MDNASRQHHFAPSPATSSAVATFLVSDCDRDQPGISMPRAETHLVVRFGPSARGGLDAHAIGGRERAHRKTIRAGQRTLMARLRLGAHEAVLGVPAALTFDRIVALEDLWGEAVTRRLLGRLGDAATPGEAALILEGAIAERLQLAPEHDASSVVRAAAQRLELASVSAVADDLDVSERTLRRTFLDVVGMGPKAFAKLARFHRAVRAAREGTHSGWASIALHAGYYDQAHLIAEFRDLAGVTPRALLEELQPATETSAPAEAPGQSPRRARASQAR